MQQSNKMTKRRQILKTGISLASMPLLGSLVSCSKQQQSEQGADESTSTPQAAARLRTESLTETVTMVSGAPGNVLALKTDTGLVLVDSGSAALASSVLLSLQEGLGDTRVHTLINTHYHPDQTGGNALFGEAGAAIHAHEITRQWLSADYYIPAEDRWVEAPPAIARPTHTFRNKGELATGAETIEYGYLLEAHTRGDAYVLLREANIIAVGDVASPFLDPSLDWYAGGWLGGRVDAMDELLTLANTDTQFVPAYGPVMSLADFQAERDMMWHLWERCSTLVSNGRSAQDMLEAGVMDEIDRKFDDPYRFLYDVARGLWAHYTNFGGKTV
jgi:glyoxylase-like metal-dependent hydrolase (beta-lactamase superfamily II)